MPGVPPILPFLKNVSHACDRIQAGSRYGMTARNEIVRLSGISVRVTSHARPHPMTIESAETVTPTASEFRIGL